jgi:hypothetical protein
LTERLSRLLLQIDNEKSVVVEVGHDGGAVRLEADAARGVEVLPQVAFEAVLQQELAGRGKKLEGKEKQIKFKNKKIKTKNRSKF